MLLIFHILNHHKPMSSHQAFHYDWLKNLVDQNLMRLLFEDYLENLR